MNFMNRKLFKGRAARDKLNKMGGIMASSQPLMNTVQNFNVGGGVQSTASTRIPTSGMGLKGFVPNMNRQDFLRLPLEQQRKFIQAEQNRRYLNRVGSKAGILAGGYSDTVLNPLIGLANLGVEGAKRLGLTDPTSDFSIPYTDSVGKSVERLDKNEYIPGESLEEQAQAYAGLLATERGEFQDPQIANAMARYKREQEQDKAVSDEIASEYLSDLTPPGQFMMPGVTPSPDKKEEPATTPEAAAARLTDGAARDKGAAGPVAQDQVFMNAAKSGELGAEKQVQAIMNEGTEPEVEMTLEQLMAEFTSAAPKREGLDKGLAIAKIGFAMAAGQSPDAISNIATALMGGADMFIKDKAEKDAFDRQVQLSALQYGLGEIGKGRAEARLEAREGRKPTFWVADKDMTFNGKSYKEGETVAVPTAYIQEKGLPEGITLPAMAKAAMDTNAVIQKALNKAAQDGIMKPSDYRKNSEVMTQAATDFSTSNRLREITQSQLINVAEGKVTGLANASAGVINKAASAVGVDLGKQFQTVEEYNAAMQKVANQLVNDLLGEGSKTMSDMDRRLAQEIVGFYGSSLFNYTFADPDVLKDRLQGTLVEVENKNRRALNTMRDVMDASAGYTLKSGNPVVYREALSVAGPYLSEDVRSDFGLTKVGEENGIPVYDFSK